MGQSKAIFAYMGVLDLWREDMTLDYIHKVFEVALARNTYGIIR